MNTYLFLNDNGTILEITEHANDIAARERASELLDLLKVPSVVTALFIDKVSLRPLHQFSVELKGA